MSDSNDFYSRYLDGGCDDTPKTAPAGLADSGTFPQEATPRGPAFDETFGYDAGSVTDLDPAQPGMVGVAGAPPEHRNNSEPVGALDVGRHTPGGPPRQAPSGTMFVSDGVSFHGEPQQFAPPPDYTPSSVPDVVAPHAGQLPRLDGRYSPGTGEEVRQHLGQQVPDDVRDASVGALRAQIRESQVAPLYKPVPQMGWRKSLYRVTRINLGLSQDERDWNDLERRLTVDLRGNYVIAVMGAKGGVNKTAATICIGMALKQYRDEKIVAIDANPANGNLATRIKEPSTMSWRGLINDPNLRQYRDFRVYMGKDSKTGLEVLGSDPGDQVLTGQDLVTAWQRLQVQYPIAIVDCGNQVRDDITKAILDVLPVDAVVVPSTTRLDGARGAAQTLNWLLTHGYPHLVRQAVVVVSNINKIDASDQVRGLHEDFQKAVRAVHDAPFDQHLSDAVAIEFWRLRPQTRRAYIEAAASLVDGFAAAADRESATGAWSGHGGQR